MEQYIHVAESLNIYYTQNKKDAYTYIHANSQLLYTQESINTVDKFHLKHSLC